MIVEDVRRSSQTAGDAVILSFGARKMNDTIGYVNVTLADLSDSEALRPGQKVRVTIEFPSEI